MSFTSKYFAVVVAVFVLCIFSACTRLMAQTPPTALSPTQVTGVSFVANWTVTANTRTTFVYVSTTSDFSSFVSGYNGTGVAGTETSLNITGLTPGVTYYYRVRAMLAMPITDFSNTVTITLPTEIPIALPATLVTSNSFVANWSTIISSPTSFVYVSTSSDFSTHVEGYNGKTVGGTSLTITGLLPGVTYYYRVRVLLSMPLSGYSNVISVTTPPPPIPPDTPTALAATNVTVNSFKANWTTVTFANEYKIDVSDNEDFSSFVSPYNNYTAGTGSSVVVSVSGERKYYYRVRAVNTYGSSGNSNEVVVNLSPSDVTIKTIQIPTVTDASQITDLSGNALEHSIEYFDGLGRPIQTVSVQSSSSGQDVITPVVYDRIGRQSTQYLPYAGGKGGSYKPDFSNEHNRFYTGGTTVATDTKPYAQTIFEASPLNRPVKQGAAGDAWQPDSDNTYASGDRTKKMAYGVNQINEVLYFEPVKADATYPTGMVKLGNPAYYRTGQLNKSRTKNEHGNEVIEFTDKQGRTILKKVQVDAVTYAQTYYVYDDFGNLVCVLPPEATLGVLSRLAITWGSVVGVSSGGVYNSNLTKTAASSYGNAAATISSLASGQDGWVEMVADETNTSRMIGLASGPGNSGTNIAFALEFRNNGNIYIWEGDVVVNSLGTYTQGTVVRVAREAGLIKYYVNGQNRQTSAATVPAGLMVADCAINEKGGTIKWVTASFNVTISSIAIAVNNFGFLYTYDSRGRMSQKKSPGISPVYMVYDKRDRLVLTQDGNLRASKYWSFTKYDVFNRAVLTGIKDTAAVLSQEEMQAVVNNFYSKPGARYVETFVGYTGANVHGYTNKSYPIYTSGTTVDVNHFLTATYYDGYNFRQGWKGSAYAYKTDELTQTADGYPYTQVTSAFETVNGQITGTKVKVLDDGLRGLYSWLKTAVYYDDKYRQIQVVSDNLKGGVDRESYLHDFTGKVLKQQTTHTRADLVWTDMIGTRFVGNRLYRSVANNSWGESGAASVQVLPAGQDGWVEFTAAESDRARIVGLSDQNIDANFSTIDYAISLRQDNQVVIREGGNETKVLTTGYKTGDVFRIARVGTAIKYYQNDVEVYPAGAAVTQTPSTTKLLVDAIFFNSGCGVTNVRASFAETTESVKRRFTYDHSGRLTETYHSFGNGASEVLLARNTYNEIGQLIDKDLHSVNGSPFKQSVDYRYNIRGWLTSINKASLDNDGIINDDAAGIDKDYFGMDIAYNTTQLGVGNTPAFNGNISGVAWSNNQGLGTIKQNGYAYTYDAMSRLTGSAFKERTTTTWSAVSNGGFAEANLTYDLNGNILTLTRNDKRTTGIMDDLVYDYGTGSTRTNKLLKVTDAGDKTTGFIDATSTGNDYLYDANGNLRRDLNKGIGTSTDDITNLISYNFLNLPTTVVKGENTIRYIYDANGRKLTQEVGTGTVILRADYVGDFLYENNELQFLNHEEGRVVTRAMKLVYTNSCDNMDAMAAQSATLEIVTIDSEKYVKATATATNRPGIFPVGDGIPVQGGERYKIRVKGYRMPGTGTISHAANLLIKTNGIDLNWPGALLPAGATAVKTESWIEQTVTIPTGHTLLEAGVAGGTGFLVGEELYLNEFEIIKLDENEAEYQYHIKDHLGNVRVTFTTRQEIESATATLETENKANEEGEFQNYAEAVKINFALFDHTRNDATPIPGKSYYSTRLGGEANGRQEKYGLAKSLSVMPGDKIDVEVFAKYLDPNSANWTTALTDLITSIATGTAAAGTIVDGGAAGSLGNGTFLYPGILTRTDDTGTGPKAYLNWIIFDRNFKYLDGGFRRVTEAARESGADGAHERIGAEITVKSAGYVYIYLSNEDENSVEVFFDDLKVDLIRGAVVQIDDYYPFGLSFNGGQRENSVNQNYKYNGKEEQTELGLNVYDYENRMYDATIGRWWMVDALSDISRRWSMYAYCYNNPLIFVDRDGMFGEYYANDGTYIGSDGKDDDKAYLVDNYEKSQTQEHDDGTASTIVLNTDVHELKDQAGNAISNSTLQKFAATIYSESGGEKKESYGIGSAVMNYLKESKGKYSLDKLVSNANTYSYGVGDANYNLFLNSSMIERNDRSATGAAINAIQGGEDYSNGATHWDGDDLGPDGRAHYRRTVGFEVSAEHAKTYLKNNGWDVKDKNGKKKTFTSTSDKQAFKSISAQGKTIFWKGTGISNVIFHKKRVIK